MPIDRDRICPEHSPKFSKDTRERNKERMAAFEGLLPDVKEAQAGPFRHLCPYCIYEKAKKKGYDAGYARGLIEGKVEAGEKIKNLILS